MSRLLALALVAQLVACEEASEPFPVTPGGGGGGTGTGAQPDAGIDASDASITITGRVCLLLSNANIQTLSGCALTGAGGLTVLLDTQVAITADDGTFTILRPTDTTDLVWRVSGTDVISSAVRFGTVLQLPVIAATAYEEALGATGAAIGNGDGALIVRVVRAGLAVQGAVVSVSPEPTNGQIFYDGIDQSVWETDATGIFGVAWVPSQPPGIATLSLSVGSTVTLVPDVPVFQSTITFVVAEIP